MLSMEMPGVDRHGVEVRLEKEVLTVVGQVNFSNYEGLEPIYTEYGIGHDTRSLRSLIRSIRGRSPRGPTTACCSST